MEKNLYAIKGYASYFDRKIRKMSTVSEYFSGRSFWRACRVNFQLNDGITSSVVFNIDNADSKEIDENGVPNYLLVCSLINEIESRWFITECKYIRENQYELSLRRDVIADYLDDVLLAPCLVERGPLPESSPYLLNQEEMALNQIKRRELLLKDETGSAWIVGYVSSDTTDDSEIVADTPESRTAAYPNVSTLGIDWTDDADLSKGGSFSGCYQDIDYVTVERVQEKWDGSEGLSIIKSKLFFLHSNGTTEELWGITALTRKWTVQHLITDYDQTVWSKAAQDTSSWSSRVSSSRSSLDDDFATKHGVGTLSDYQKVMAANGQIFYDSVNQKYYRLTVTQAETSQIDDLCEENELPALRARLMSLSIAQAQSYGADGSYNQDGSVAAHAKISTITISAEEVYVAGQIKTTMTATRRKLCDAPYDMFCLKFNEQNLALAYKIATAPPAAGKVKKIYDLQILPYCPRRDAMKAADISSLTEDVDYQKIYLSVEDGQGNTTDTLIGYLFWCVQSSFSFDVPVPVQFGNVNMMEILSRTGQRAMDLKLSQLCDLFRLSSPNYSAAFDFSLAKNGGSVSSFRVDFTYRPVMPYIHVCPMFSGLYGSYNNDARGLICGGDYSIDMVSDPWTEYMSNNKNYENIFNTNIKRMDAIREYDRGALALSGTLSTAAATIAGAAKGGVAGAAVGFGAAAARAIGQGVISEGKYQAERKAAIDTFRYELGNVQAAPNSLTKVSAYNVNNKYFPLVEWYSCTDQEVSAIVEYFRLYNFRVGAMSTLKEILDSGRTKSWEFVKGKIVLFQEDARSEDNHFLEEVYAEIDRGVFIYG